MSSLRQIEANRRNAQKSTGPTSVTGKAASSMNALKTGIHAKSLLLPSEKLADLELLIDEYYDHHNPTTPEALSEPRGLRQGLKDAGFVEGENLTIEYRWADNQTERLQAMAAELVRRRVSLIVSDWRRQELSSRR